MALATYGDLKTSIASWLVRSDLTSVIPDFVSLAEADIRLDVRCLAMEQLATGTITSETIAHPTRYIEGKVLNVDNTRFDYVTSDRYLALGTTSEAYVYTSIGQNLYVKGSAGKSYTLIYYQSFVDFSGDSDTNWLLTNFPDVYLSGACRHGAHYLRDSDEESKWAARYAGTVARVGAQQNRASAPGQLRVIPA